MTKYVVTIYYSPLSGEAKEAVFYCDSQTEAHEKVSRIKKKLGWCAVYVGSVIETIDDNFNRQGDDTNVH
jgi:hypothetical protein